MSLTLIIIAFTVLISWMGFQNREVITKCKHWPYEESRSREFYRWVTSGFVHADWMHLGVNMFVLWSFGTAVERMFAVEFSFGSTFFLVFYLLGIVFAGLPGYFQHKNNPGFASIGASGAVSAVTFASILFSPNSNIYLYAAIPIKAWLFGILYLAFETYQGRRGGSNIDHAAHFWGAVFGLTLPSMLKPELLSNFLQAIIGG